MKRAPSLAERQNDLTRRLILDAAIAELDQEDVHSLTIRAVANRANISERTVFRYFPSRDEFLSAVAASVREELKLPAPPTSLDELRAAPDALYRAFESNVSLTRAALHTELLPHMRDAQVKLRGAAIARIVDAHLPKRSEKDRKLVTSNIRYTLSATTWHYYRFNFGLSLEDSIACAELAIRQALMN